MNNASSAPWCSPPSLTALDQLGSYAVGVGIGAHQYDEEIEAVPRLGEMLGNVHASQ
jgi:hypothetical protein